VIGEESMNAGMMTKWQQGEEDVIFECFSSEPDT
jgi:hypothetical protein